MNYTLTDLGWTPIYKRKRAETLATIRAMALLDSSKMLLIARVHSNVVRDGMIYEWRVREKEIFRVRQGISEHEDTFFAFRFKHGHHWHYGWAETYR